MERPRPALQDISSFPYDMRLGYSETNLVLPTDLRTSSPEEQIIRQRSRRFLMQATALEVKGSQKVDATVLRTPTKDDTFAQLSRKRLMMSPQRRHSSPISPYTPKNPSPRSAKKPRLLKRLSTPVNLAEEIKPYTSEELVSIIDKLVFINPDLEDEMRGNLTPPDIHPMIARLQSLRRSVFKAIPSTRWGSRRDAHCYRHVKEHLDSFRQSCIEQGRELIVAHHWESVMRYVITSWRIINNLPSWDDPSHNTRCKLHCFQVLAAQCMVALKHAQLSPSQYYDIKDRLQKAVTINSGLAPCVAYISKMLENNNNKPSAME